MIIIIVFVFARVIGGGRINASVTGASFPGVMAMAWLLSPARGRLGMWLGIHQKKR